MRARGVESSYEQSQIVMLTIEKVFGMEGGHVLNFSDRTFAEFFAAELNVDIDDAVYAKNGGSKGKRMRQFLHTSDPALSARALRKLWDYREAPAAISGKMSRCRGLVTSCFRSFIGSKVTAALRGPMRSSVLPRMKRLMSLWQASNATLPRASRMWRWTVCTPTA